MYSNYLGFLEFQCYTFNRASDCLHITKIAGVCHDFFCLGQSHHPLWGDFGPRLMSTQIIYDDQYWNYIYIWWSYIPSITYGKNCFWFWDKKIQCYNMGNIKSGPKSPRSTVHKIWPRVWFFSGSQHFLMSVYLYWFLNMHFHSNSDINISHAYGQKELSEMPIISMLST